MTESVRRIYAECLEVDSFKSGRHGFSPAQFFWWLTQVESHSGVREPSALLSRVSAFGCGFPLSTKS